VAAANLRTMSVSPPMRVRLAVGVPSPCMDSQGLPAGCLLEHNVSHRPTEAPAAMPEKMPAARRIAALQVSMRRQVPLRTWLFGCGPAGLYRSLHNGRRARFDSGRAFRKPERGGPDGKS